jgi:hypothetical protein
MTFRFALAIADLLVDDPGILLSLCLGLCRLTGLPDGHSLVLHLRIAPVAMLAPPRARRIRPGGAATRKEAVDTYSYARFGGEVEWNMRRTTTFLRVPPVAK